MPSTRCLQARQFLNGRPIRFHYDQILVHLDEVHLLRGLTQVIIGYSQDGENEPQAGLFHFESDVKATAIMRALKRYRWKDRQIRCCFIDEPEKAAFHRHYRVQNVKPSNWWGSYQRQCDSVQRQGSRFGSNHRNARGQHHGGPSSGQRIDPVPHRHHRTAERSPPISRRSPDKARSTRTEPTPKSEPASPQPPQTKSAKESVKHDKSVSSKSPLIVSKEAPPSASASSSTAASQESTAPVQVVATVTLSAVKSKQSSKQLNSKLAFKIKKERLANSVETPLQPASSGVQCTTSKESHSINSKEQSATKDKETTPDQTKSSKVKASAPKRLSKRANIHTSNEIHYLTRAKCQSISQYGSADTPKQAGGPSKPTKVPRKKPPTTERQPRKKARKGPPPASVVNASQQSQAVIINPLDATENAVNKPRQLNMDFCSLPQIIEPSNLPILWRGILQCISYEDIVRATIDLHFISGRVDEAMIWQVLGRPPTPRPVLLNRHNLQDRTASAISFVDLFINKSNQSLYLALPANIGPAKKHVNSANLQRLVEMLEHDQISGSVIFSQANSHALVNFLIIDERLQQIFQRYIPSFVTMLNTRLSSTAKLLVILQYFSS